MKEPGERGGVVMEPDLRLLPDPAPWQYGSLVASIRRYGVILPAVKDEYGGVIDGTSEAMMTTKTMKQVRATRSSGRVGA